MGDVGLQGDDEVSGEHRYFRGRFGYALLDRPVWATGTRWHEIKFLSNIDATASFLDK